MSDTKMKKASATVSVHIKAAEAVRVSVGTRWEVVASSRGSLWDDTCTIELKEIKSEVSGK